MYRVFEESNISNLKLKNRIIRSATHEGLSDIDGNPQDGLKKKYIALAKGGVGAIITGHTGVMKSGKVDIYHMAMLDNDSLIPAHRDLVKSVHEYDTKLILQISHCGRQADSRKTGHKTVAPSPVKEKFYSNGIPHELTEDEIYNIIDHFVAAIERAKKCGYDGVQLHIAHGYLLSTFVSPRTNLRKDKWGGSSENRFRIVKEILSGAREKVGDFPILAKINGYEKSKGGVKTPHAVETAKLLEKFGCCAVEISCGMGEEGLYTIRGDIPFDMIFHDHDTLNKLPKFTRPLVKKVLMGKMGSPEDKHLYNLSSAVEIRKHINIPVIVVGGVRSLKDIEHIIEEKNCDYVSMSRPFIIEPAIVQKFKDGKQTESKCINCNFCLMGLRKGTLRCYYGRVPKK